MKKNKVTVRSIGFAVHFQLEAICRHLRTVVLNGIEPGPKTRDIVKALRDDFVVRTTGKAIEYIPDVADGITPDDLLAIAELTLATSAAFLSPEESEERERMGFIAERTRTEQ